VPGPDLEVSPYFNQMNRGKRSIGIDITTDRGAELVRELARTCDVVAENMRPGALERRNLGYDALSEVNPGIVMLSMSMMGQTGPLRSIGGYAPVMSGLTGLDSLVGYSRDDLIGLYNPALGDPNGAAHGLALLLAALRHRAVTGHGAWLDLAQVECLMSILRVPVILADAAVPVDPPANAHSHFPIHGTFRARGVDAWVSVVARTKDEVESLAAAAGSSVGSGVPLADAVASWCLSRDPDAAALVLNAAGVPAAAVVSAEAMESSAWASDRGLHATTRHPYLGDQIVYGLTWKRNARSFLPTRAAPLFGADTSEVLISNAGLEQNDVAALASAGVIVMPEA
jgi:crotonobetainyl-CoA:carnitine CoA-transferase CaiB-like acyl-CoA transferase